MAGKRLIWSIDAKCELNEILRFFRKRNGNNEYSRRLSQEFRLTQKHIEQNELIGQQIGNTNLRFVVVVNTYRMFYRIESKQNTVVSVWDGRRNPEDLKVE